MKSRSVTRSVPRIYHRDLPTDRAQNRQFAAAGTEFPRLDGVLHNAGILGVVAPLTEQPGTVMAGCNAGGMLMGPLYWHRHCYRSCWKSPQRFAGIHIIKVSAARGRAG